MISDINLVNQIITLNGQPFISGTTITGEGDYTLYAYGIDKAGHETSLTYHFTIDKTKPTVQISGVVDGEYYFDAPTAHFSATDDNLLSYSATLNGQPFVSGTTIDIEDILTLIVTATDKAGNQTSETLTFIYDRFSPEIKISGVQDGAYYNIDVIPVIEIVDTNLKNQIITLNGQPYISGTPITAEGDYTLYVYGIDKVGNEVSATYHFTIDKTLPTIVLNTPQRDYTMLEKLLINYNATDSSGIQNTTATLDGQTVQNNQSLDLFYLGFADHTLVIEATDNAGNTSVFQYVFNIIANLPTLDLMVDRAYNEKYIRSDNTYKHIKRQLAKAAELKKQGRPRDTAKYLGKLRRKILLKYADTIDPYMVNVLVGNLDYILATLSPVDPKEIEALGLGEVDNI